MSVRRLFLILVLVLVSGSVFAVIVPSRITVLDNRVISDGEVLEILDIQRGKAVTFQMFTIVSMNLPVF